MTYLHCLYIYIAISLFFALNAIFGVCYKPEWFSDDENAVKEVKEATKKSNVFELFLTFIVIAIIWPYLIVHAYLRDRKKKKT